MGSAARAAAVSGGAYCSWASWSNTFTASHRPSTTAIERVVNLLGPNVATRHVPWLTALSTAGAGAGAGAGAAAGARAVPVSTVPASVWCDAEGTCFGAARLRMVGTSFRHTASKKRRYAPHSSWRRGMLSWPASKYSGGVRQSTNRSASLTTPANLSAYMMHDHNPATTRRAKRSTCPSNRAPAKTTGRPREYTPATTEAARLYSM